MTKRLSLALMVCIAALVLFVAGVAADPHQIPVGGDVFIGEQGLDITATGVTSGSTISYYTGDQTPGVSVPSATLKVADATNFYVAPADFLGRTGNWYIGNTNTVAFQAKDPSLDIKVWDQNAQKDVTGKSVPAGDFLNFRVESNIYTISNRPDFDAVNSTGLPTIKVKTADGTVYTKLFETTTVSNKLTNQPVNAQPFYWVPVNNATRGWATAVLDAQGNRIYKAGVYSVWIESNINKMKDNYKDASGADFTGKTLSATKTVTIASDTVAIEASKDSVVRGNPFSVTITGRPNTAYFLWVKGTSSMSGKTVDQPPAIASNQDNVAQDQPNAINIGLYQFQGGAGHTIQQDVPKFLGDTNTNGTSYYASVTLSNSGTRTVGFVTSKDTKDKKYTIRVERSEPVRNFGDDRQFKSDEVDITIEKGAVTIVAAGDQSYFLGEEVKLSGTNSETDNVFMFITGPNLPSVGGPLTNPRIAVRDGVANSFTTADVLEDNTWSYKWQTANLNIDAGTYTIYAVATANDKDHLADTQYATVSIIVRKPFVSATASQSVVARGDKLFLRGTAEGKPTQGVAIWILGKNKVIYDTESVNADSTFEFEVTTAVTKDLASGQYFVVVQHPMYNDQFDVYPSANRDLVLGTYPVAGNTLFTLQGPGSLQGSDAAEALVQALNNPSVDDTYTKLQFLVEEPTIRINAVGEHAVGDKFFINGTTNFAVDDQILVEVTSSSFQPTQKTQSGEFSGQTGTVNVVKGTDGFNTWSFPVDASTFKPDEYIIKASGITIDASATTLFNVVEFKPTPVPTTVVTTAPVNTTIPTTAPPTTVVPTTAKPTTAPGFGALIALIGLGAVAFLVVRKH